MRRFLARTVCAVVGVILLPRSLFRLNIADKLSVCSVGVAVPRELMRRDALVPACLPLMVAWAVPTAAGALVPQPEVLAQALVDVEAALNMLDLPAAEVSRTAARIQQLLQRSLPEVGEAAAATYAR